MNTQELYSIKKMSPQFIVLSLEQSIEFYTSKLNFDIDFRYEDFYAGISKNGYSIHLKLGKPYKEERRHKRNNQDLDITFSVNNIEDVYQTLLSKHVEMLQPLRNMPYGKEFYIVDPDGYIIAFLEEA